MPNLTAIPAKGPNYPQGDSIRITRGLGGCTHRVRSCAPSSKSNHPLGDSIRITRGLRGYYRGSIIGVPKEVELVTIKR